MKEAFQKWIPLDRLCIADLPKYGNFPAVYAIRDCTTKEILKYGHSQQFRQRFFLNYLSGWGGGATQRIYLDLYDHNMIKCVEVGWIQNDTKDEAARSESALRKEFMNTHGGQRPQWDRRD